LETDKVYRILYPAVPAVLAVYAEGGRTFAMPAVSITSLSGSPPLLGVSIAPNHATHSAIVRTRRFSVSWFDKRYSLALEKLGTTSALEVDDKLASVGLHHTPDGRSSVPVIEEADAHLECVLVARRRTGDHDLLISRVDRARVSEDFGEYWRFESYKPILYAGLQKGMKLYPD
jgi:flavin reductase ActVB